MIKERGGNRELPQIPALSFGRQPETRILAGTFFQYTDCLSDAPLVPGTFLERFLDFRGLRNKFLERRQMGKVRSSTNCGGKRLPDGT